MEASNCNIIIYVLVRSEGCRQILKRELELLARISGDPLQSLGVEYVCFILRDNCAFQNAMEQSKFSMWQCLATLPSKCKLQHLPDISISYCDAKIDKVLQ